ncbi:CPBP family intramembrane glutamic endopeptidase [Modestobacter altitudinis]|uniref:CPBP family intramembrane glutamic endopeptidase n=1 Tax=Modestobacter altitudinis TaxID=2213158 RepID=UPI00110CD383|nr:type II CAAX endopeptidase family protein [Modestobacter altitudinis]
MSAVDDPRLTTRRTTPPGFRGWVARRPLTAFLVLVFGLGWPLVSVPALADHGVLPGGEVPEEPFTLALTLLVMLPAALWVTAVADGRPAVRVLLRRALRWRFSPGWWAAVVLALPLLTLGLGVLGGRSLDTGDLAGALAGAVVSIITAVVLVHLWEETVWAGFFQGRLEPRYGYLPAAAMTAVPFAAIHLPLQFIGDSSAGELLTAVGALLVFGLVMRLMVGVTVHGAAGSLLAAGVVHAVFNASNNSGDLADELLSGGQPTGFAVAAAALFTAAAYATLRARGRAR